MNEINDNSIDKQLKIFLNFFFGNIYSIQICIFIICIYFFLLHVKQVLTFDSQMTMLTFYFTANNKILIFSFTNLNVFYTAFVQVLKYEDEQSSSHTTLGV